MLDCLLIPAIQQQIIAVNGLKHAAKLGGKLKQNQELISGLAHTRLIPKIGTSLALTSAITL